MTQNITLTEAEADALTGIAIDFNALTITLTEDRTVSEVYDYWKAQFVKEANFSATEENKLEWVCFGFTELFLNKH